MDHFNFLPPELNEILISYLSFNDLENFINFIPYKDLLYWIGISKYRYNENFNENLYLSYLSIESLKQKLIKLISLNKMKLKNIYNLRKLDLNANKIKEI